MLTATETAKYGQQYQNAFSDIYIIQCDTVLQFTCAAQDTSAGHVARRLSIHGLGIVFYVVLQQTPGRGENEMVMCKTVVHCRG